MEHVIVVIIQTRGHTLVIVIVIDLFDNSGPFNDGFFCVYHRLKVIFFCHLYFGMQPLVSVVHVHIMFDY